MKSILVIGMGRFGRHLSMKMSELDNEVMVVDINEARVQEVLPYVTNAQIGDCTKEDTLRALGVSDFDICFVCMGSNFQSSLEVTSLVKELGAKMVVSRASRDVHEKFLLRNGADRVVYPEKILGEKLAYQYTARNVYDFIKLNEDVSIYEVPILPEWTNKSIGDCNIRAKYGINILAIKENDNTVNPMPDSSHIFRAEEHVMVIGRMADVQKILKRM